jgi:predicted nucleotidyltransferase component of viral defense system
MNEKSKRDLSASVKSRLLALARDRSEELQYVLIRYGIERLLYRLSRSPHSNRFILKGATLHTGWEGGAYRRTKDLDLLGTGDNSTEALAGVFREITQTEVPPDGLRFEADSIRARAIREEGIYSGVRVQVVAHLGKARIPLQVDVGFGDPVTPGPVELQIPSLLDFPAPRLQAYPAETVVAEKLETLVRLGMRTSRIKDLYDLWYAASHFPFEGSLLHRAIRNTFLARRTAMPSEPPIALTGEFTLDSSKQVLWRSFATRSGIEQPADLAQLHELLQAFLLPLVMSLEVDFTATWTPGGPWRDARTKTD